MAMRGAPSGAKGGDRGSVAAELALALPAVVLAVALGVGALAAASRQVALQDAAADAARLLGRGQSQGDASHVVTAQIPGAALSSRGAGDLVCVTATSDVRLGGAMSLPLSATACALAGGL